MEGINDDDESLRKYAEVLKKLKYDRLYINTPVRLPAESYVMAIDHEKMNHAVDLLGGISIDLLVSLGFHSEIKDDYEAILSIIKRHPMNQFEIVGFLKARGNIDCDEFLNRLRRDDFVISMKYKGYDTYRLK